VCEVGQSLRVSFGGAFVDDDRLAFDVSELAQTLTEHGNAALEQCGT